MCMAGPGMAQWRDVDPQEPPEGYYAFIESPRVRSGQKSLNNLCGDLNKGTIPRNPMEQHVLGHPYPFELLKNKTLQFFSKTLPILKADETLPKVAKYQKVEDQPFTSNHLSSNSHLMCMIYKAFNGESLAPTIGGGIERREDISGENVDYRRGETSPPSPPQGQHDPQLPPTPCPAKVEYATPVFAKNYQGVWRYVVQIPYEGYFTQTVEVTRCL
uniref:Spaetzle domain-containing protein n=1 Tax=Timema monikensis TaxID=170555 RepID=A0A7R9HQZ6_9NEOP|nr:unnamed protein product [Timema monikensis]